MKRLLFGLLGACLVVVACSDDTTPAGTGGATDAGTDSGHAGHDDHDAAPAPVDAGLPPVKCSADELAANVVDGNAVEITFPKTAEPAQYVKNCLTVKAGTAITFTGSFVQHPLEAAGGDQPNPIPYTNTDQPNGKVVVTVPSAGTFGYRCEYHPSLMYGAIRVVP